MFTFISSYTVVRKKNYKLSRVNSQKKRKKKAFVEKGFLGFSFPSSEVLFIKRNYLFLKDINFERHII